MSQVECPLCQQRLFQRWDRVEDSESREEFSVSTCPKCGLGVTLPFPADLDRYYPKEYHGGRHSFTAKLCDRRRMRIVSAASRSSGPGYLLDVGCGDGTFLRLAQKRGWQVQGVEKYSDRAQFDGVNVVSSIAEAGESPTYDCVTLWHVLEHLPDLNKSIDGIQKLLKPNGNLIIAVPDFASLQSRVFGSHWFHLDVPRHLYHFTENALVELLSRHALKTKRLRCSEFEYDLLGWVQSALNQSGLERNVFFKLLTKKRANVSLIQSGLHFALGTALCAVGFFPVLISGYLGTGGTLMVTACKAKPENEESKHV